MSKIRSIVGVIEENDGKIFVRTERADRGCVVYGPYEKLGKGKYFVKFGIRPDTKARRDLVCCRVDVVSDFGGVKLVERDVTVEELRDGGDEVEVQFELNRAAVVEYRVFALGTVGLFVSNERSASFIFDDTSDFSFVSGATTIDDTCVFRPNYQKISYFAGLGAQFSVIDGDLAVAFAGVNAHLFTSENIRIFEEVFFNKSYAVDLPKKCVAVDIGMNVGLASLALANNSMIERVYGFEPFGTAFNRALKNIELNPELKLKISPRKFGLYDRDTLLEVFAQDERSGGNSVRGFSNGTREVIELRDACRELRTIIGDANERGLGVVVKVDCEGSEFPIFEVIERGDLFESIDAVMMEWHSGWSKEKNQHDLVRPLVRSGFAVFDRTEIGARIGMVLAVKTSPAFSTSEDRAKARASNPSQRKLAI